MLIGGRAPLGSILSTTHPPQKKEKINYVIHFLIPQVFKLLVHKEEKLVFSMCLYLKECSSEKFGWTVKPFHI